MAKKSGKSKVAAQSKPRRLKPAQYKNFRLQKRIKHAVRLPSVYALSKQAWQIFWQHKGVLSGITLIYGLASFILVQGVAGGTDVSQLKALISDASAGSLGALASSLSVFAILVGSAGSESGSASASYQFSITIIASLAIIWALRQVLTGASFRVRDAYYRGMYPLIPFLLVLFVIGLQLIPLLLGATLYSLVIETGIAALPIERLLWAVLNGLLALLSLYMLSSSLFALYIVTLPDMTPMKALRSARNLVRHRRWTVLRKIIALPVILLVAAAGIMVPIIMWFTPLSQWIFFILTMFAVLAVHTYMYNLYRELLNE